LDGQAHPVEGGVPGLPPLEHFGQLGELDHRRTSRLVTRSRAFSIKLTELVMNAIEGGDDGDGLGALSNRDCLGADSLFLLSWSRSYTYLSPMRIEQLEYVTSVARFGSFRRAAEELHISQPALSETVRKLEQELGVDILDRRRSGATISEDGR